MNQRDREAGRRAGELTAGGSGSFSPLFSPLTSTSEREKLELAYRKLTTQLTENKMVETELTKLESAPPPPSLPPSSLSSSPSTLYSEMAARSTSLLAPS